MSTHNDNDDVILAFGGLGDEYRLVELPKQIVEGEGSDLLRSLVLKAGEEKGECHLCTPYHSFAMKFVESSNQLMLVNSEASEISKKRKRVEEIQGTVGGHYELQPIRCCTRQMASLLKEGKEIDEDDDEDMGSSKPYSLDDFDRMVPYSRHEIKEGLKLLGAFEVDGVYRMVSHNYQESILRMIFATFTEQGWSPSSFPLVDCISVLVSDFPAPVLAHVLKIFGKKPEGGKEKEGGEGDGKMWGMDGKKVVKFLGEGFMRKKNIIAKEELFRLWEASLPEELSSSSSFSSSPDFPAVSPSLSLLRGLAIPLSDDSNPLIRFCDRDSLPLEPKQRFIALFDIKPMWGSEELEAYCEDLVSPLVSSKQLLMKFARGVMVGGVKKFCAR